MKPWDDDGDNLADDLQSMSFNSTTTTTHRTTSSSSEATFNASSNTLGSSLNSSTSARLINNISNRTSLDPCWEAIHTITRSQTNQQQRPLTFTDLCFLHRLGSGDIGSVYLTELHHAERCLFAAKVMDRKELAKRNKEGRAETEREILECLDHPFLPTLYASLESPKWYCLLTEFCPGGDLHVLRQRQLNKRFHESAVR